MSNNVLDILVKRNLIREYKAGEKLLDGSEYIWLIFHDDTVIEVHSTETLYISELPSQSL